MRGNPESMSDFSPEKDNFNPLDIRAYLIKHREAIFSSDTQRSDGRDYASGAMIRIMATDRQEKSRQEIMDETRQDVEESGASEEKIKAQMDRCKASIDGLIQNGVLVEQDGMLKLNRSS